MTKEEHLKEKAKKDLDMIENYKKRLKIKAVYYRMNNLLINTNKKLLFVINGIYMYKINIIIKCLQNQYENIIYRVYTI